MLQWLFNAQRLQTGLLVIGVGLLLGIIIGVQGTINGLKAIGKKAVGWWQTLEPRYKQFLLGASVVLLPMVILVEWIPQRQLAPVGVGASCEDPPANRALTQEAYKTILPNHQAWLKSRENSDDKRVKICDAELNELKKEKGREYINHWKANLKGHDLQGHDLQWTDLRGADLREANLHKAKLRCADLHGANLYRANLEEAHLWDANLQGVCLDRANVHKADLGGVNLQDAVFEPIPDKLPDYGTLAHPRNRLETLVFRYSPAALMALRGAFKNGGMRTQERQLTYAIESTKRWEEWNPAWHTPTREDERQWREKAWGKLESVFKLVAFELTSNYGMSYGRPLLILAVSVGLFSLIYTWVVLSIYGPAGIWMVWLPERIHKDGGEATPFRVTGTFWLSPPKSRSARRWQRGLMYWLSPWLIGLYFSLLSAFSLGWRELNVGTWISRMQFREYTLRATGWVRFVAGVQSLLSIYLLALWVLTYFGRPFE
jgi:hypothetical protein